MTSKAAFGNVAFGGYSFPKAPASVPMTMWDGDPGILLSRKGIVHSSAPKRLCILNTKKRWFFCDTRDRTAGSCYPNGMPSDLWCDAPSGALEA